MNITYKQQRWLDDRGGRNIHDVHGDEKGLYVFMGNGAGGDVKVYVPNDIQIDEAKKNDKTIKQS